MPAPIGACRQLGQQPGLPNSRLAQKLDRRRISLVDFREEAVEGAKFLGPADEVFG